MFARLIAKLLGSAGRASRLDLDAGMARDFEVPSATPRPQLRVIPGGLAIGTPRPAAAPGPLGGPRLAVRNPLQPQRRTG